jgi:hypothetical protein
MLLVGQHSSLVAIVAPPPSSSPSSLGQEDWENFDLPRYISPLENKNKTTQKWMQIVLCGVI